MAVGELVRGAGSTLLYGKDGTLLYKTTFSMAVNISVSWVDGNDCDLCAFYSHRPANKIGWSYGSEITNLGDGFTATWGGDNTTGGPESLTLAYSGGAVGLRGARFEIHLNWYNPGEDHSGGAATVTATDGSGATFSYTITPAHTKHKAAAPESPGVAIVFNFDGTIKGIEAA